MINNRERRATSIGRKEQPLVLSKENSHPNQKTPRRSKRLQNRKTLLEQQHQKQKSSEEQQPLVVTGFFSSAEAETYPGRDNGNVKGKIVAGVGDASIVTFNDDTLNQSKLGQVSTNESNLEQTFQFGSAPFDADEKRAGPAVDLNNVTDRRLFDLEEEEEEEKSQSKQDQSEPPSRGKGAPRFSFLKKNKMQSSQGEGGTEHQLTESLHQTKQHAKIAKFSPFVVRSRKPTDCNLTTVVQEGHKTVTKAMADRFIPRRGDSVDGDARAFLLMDSSCTESAGQREVSSLSMLHNLSMGPEEIAERQKEHKTNLLATMIDKKACHAQTKFTVLTDDVAQENARHLPIRNLKLTNPAPREPSNVSKDTVEGQHHPVRAMHDQLTANQQFARRLKEAKEQKRQQRRNEIDVQQEEAKDPTSSIRLRQRTFPLQSQPSRVMSAEFETYNPLATQLIDWGPAYNPLAQKMLFALALDDSIYLQDVASRESKTEHQFKSDDESSFRSISFDRSGGALLTGQDTGVVAIYDVETGQRLRKWSNDGHNCNIVSYCRSVQAPYLVAVGEGPFVGLYDVRAQNPSVLKISGHASEICGLSWSINQSSDMMRWATLDQVRLATGCADGTLGIWSLQELLRTGRESILEPSSSTLWAKNVQASPMQAIAWHPSRDGLLATGGGYPDKSIRVWDVSDTVVEGGSEESSLKHMVTCRQGITSLSWHDFTSKGDSSSDCSELLSTHANVISEGEEAFAENKMSLWQVDQVVLTHQSRKQAKYYFSKVKDFFEEGILTHAVSPCGSTIATFSYSDRISLWKMFEKRQVSLREPKGPLNDLGHRAQPFQEPTGADQEAMRLRLERLDAKLVQDCLTRRKQSSSGAL